ncbi:hypothetical protein C7N43_36325 [Sphingobacteriales bacterium UPWRP_1]|nr:hypothetical protein BVG80_00470 [Sphingobacteriales bacterium TSM_CSM]PSJ72023.1 hypothetical protein C7N43_36325 [Sphingobacteriales bacterium UPWRP_1]
MLWHLKNKIVLLLLGLCLPAACRFFDSSGNSKEQYLTDYRKWMSGINAQCNSFSKPDDPLWQKADEELAAFTGKQYRRFYPELTFKERLEISKFPVLYYLCRYKAVVKERTALEFKSEVDSLVNNLSVIMDSTAAIYKDYDAGIRQTLHEFKSRKEK